MFRKSILEMKQLTGKKHAELLGHTAWREFQRLHANHELALVLGNSEMQKHLRLAFRALNPDERRVLQRSANEHAKKIAARRCATTAEWKAFVQEQRSRGLSLDQKGFASLFCKLYPTVDLPPQIESKHGLKAAAKKKLAKLHEKLNELDDAYCTPGAVEINNTSASSTSGATAQQLVEY